MSTNATTDTATHAELYRLWRERSGLQPLEDHESLGHSSVVGSIADDGMVDAVAELSYVVDCAAAACMLGEEAVPAFLHIVYATAEYLAARPDWAAALKRQVADMGPSPLKAAREEVLMYLNMLSLNKGMANLAS